MKLNDFDYDLPESYIAQDPADPRDSSKLMVIHPEDGSVEHKVFRDILDYLREGDVLVVNRSKVLRARIVFDLEGKGSEIFLLKDLGNKVWNCLVRPGKKFKEGFSGELKDGLSVEVLEVLEDGTRNVKFDTDKQVEDFGEAPFPPYIKGSSSSLEDYQTVYALEKGSVASPTAGLHFTDSLLNRISEKGVDVEKVLLHVGLGTFAPVKTESIEDHEMHTEFFQLEKEAADRLNKAKSEGRRIIAVGTTSVRVLESCFKNGEFEPSAGETDIFIYPGYEWEAVDGLMTNFHLPKSTLIMLVASFLENKGFENGTGKILDLYEKAKRESYRFYSFGDSMLIL
jgi:S-adenosylmethionine:tRNA ribosyltransferase-isomerase